MSTMPSQLFAQNLNAGVDTALRIEAMKQQRARDVANLAMEQLRMEQSAQQDALQNQYRQQAFNRLLGNDQYQREQDAAQQKLRMDQMATDRAASEALFGDLLGRVGQNAETIRMQGGGMGPPAPVGASPIPGQMAGASDFLQKLAFDAYAKQIKDQEKQIRGFSELEQIDTQLRETRKDLEEFKPGDPNYAASKSSELWLEGEKQRRLIGAQGNPMTGLIDNILGTLGGPLFAGRNPYETAGVLMQRAQIQGELARWQALQPDARGNYVYIAPNGKEAYYSRADRDARIIQLQTQLLGLGPAGAGGPGAVDAGSMAQPMQPQPEANDPDAEREALWQELNSMMQ